MHAPQRSGGVFREALLGCCLHASFRDCIQHQDPFGRHWQLESRMRMHSIANMSASFLVIVSSRFLKARLHLPQAENLVVVRCCTLNTQYLSDCSCLFATQDAVSSKFMAQMQTLASCVLRLTLPDPAAAASLQAACSFAPAGILHLAQVRRTGGSAAEDLPAFMCPGQLIRKLHPIKACISLNLHIPNCLLACLYPAYQSCQLFFEGILYVSAA